MTSGDLLPSAAAVVKPAMAETETVSHGDHQNLSTAIVTYQEKKIVKRKRSFNLFKAAMLFINKKSGKKNSQEKTSKDIISTDSTLPEKQQQEVEEEKGGENWQKIVGSFRPLHLPENYKSLTISPSPTVENLEELATGNSSSSSVSFPSPSRYEVSSNCSMSQYASACNLQDLDAEADAEAEEAVVAVVQQNNSTAIEEINEDPDEVFDALTGDEMIDSKAEQFIAQFYQQMKLQNV